MQRFRLLGFYVAGVVAVVGLAVWGVSMRRTAADAGTPVLVAGDACAGADDDSHAATLRLLRLQSPLIEVVTVADILGSPTIPAP